MPDRNAARSPLRTPLAAGLSAAAAAAAGLGLIAALSGGQPDPVSARVSLAGLDAAPAAEQTVETDGPTRVIFAEPRDTEMSLPGVSDTAEALAAPPPAETADPASVERQARAEAPRAPLPGLFEPGPGGPLPIIAADGRRASEAYAKSFNGDAGAPTISVTVGGLGLNRALTRRAIDELPSEITLSFVPYANDLQTWVDEARAAGHEVVIELPMEPFDYPNNDPGPHTLLAGAPVAENQRRLEWLLSRASGYFGVTNYLGARLATEEAALAPIFAELERRGLDVLHDGAGRRSTLEAAGAEAEARLAVADRVIDADPAPRAIDRKLLELEALALQTGTAFGSGFAYPATVDSIIAWSEGLAARGYQLAPASFLIDLRADADRGA